VEVVELAGPDVRRFTNGMFTNNVRDLPVGAHQHSALTDDRGRLVGLLDVLMVADDRMVVALEGMSADGFESTYGMFIVFDDVELIRRPGRVLTFQGETPPDHELLCWPAPRSAAGGTDVFVPEGAHLEGEGAPVDEAALEAERIAVGWPRFPVDASDKQLPHELGLRDTHLHFEKGCYRGQEIIHRVEVMGQVRKGLVGVSLPGPVPAGADIVDPETGRKVGRSGSTAAHPELGWIGLAVVRTSHSAVGTALRVGDHPATVRATR
jgi:folate-binding protein YgfZ